MATIFPNHGANILYYYVRFSFAQGVQQIMSLNKVLGGALIVQMVILGTLVLAPAKTRTQPASAAVFDHSQCQYPERTTNPVDGCDNSDPCDPAQTKGGSGDCLPVGTEEKQQAIAEHDAAFKPAPTKAECGGK